jgi:alkanesulfonate monooxygenase SsuD/methylene tetrahydromethanopterin reductase-like flavin-dependent oxidoreductase (luciferase family)
VQPKLGRMQFGLNFFPCLSPAQKPAEQYFREAMHLIGLADELGYTHIRQVEHYFDPYGGYSPNPVVFLAAAAQRTAHARLVTGAVLPAFNNPLKLAGELGMLDGLSGGRVDAGFARAFLPHEFQHFGISLDESRRRFDEGVAQVKLLLAEENVSSEGEFHQFRNVTSYPRPTQKPHPPIWVAATATPQTFEETGRAGYSIMTIPLEPKRMRELIGIYRDARARAGHPGRGTVMSNFITCCLPSREEAMAVAREPTNGHLQGLAAAAIGWAKGASTKDYPGYDRMIAQISRETFEDQVSKGVGFVGTAADVIEMLRAYAADVGGFEAASLHVAPSTMPVDIAERSMRHFAAEVMPVVSSL